MKTYSLVIDGHSVNVLGEKIDQTVWYHYQDETYSYTPPVKSRGGSAAGQSLNELLAPMPGKIVKLFAKQGESLKSGDPVIVMEAMKMEYTLEAQVNGILERLSCQVGDQVVLGAELAYVKSVEEGS